MIAHHTFECEKSCGTIIPKGTTCYLVDGQLVCWVCAEHHA